ncbi:glycosyltransferase [Acidisphaera sp. L21]|uniref:glycosyltransferase n=1 Tax=Acidisphaera sp. L21 TaxID=1641851 RepID=UPI00131D18D5|nr:glycosyltransferase [Acidisphaera sp. L21]
MARIFHYSAAITRHDAIGYSLTALHRAMLRRGLSSHLVCDDEAVVRAPQSTMGFSDLVLLKPTAGDLVFFHYSFADRNAAGMMELPCRKIMVYHNITPGRFFRSVGQYELAKHCDVGRDFLGTMKDCFSAVIADSAFNAHELTALGYPAPEIIPVFYNDAFFASGKSENNAFLRRRIAGEISLVFIGRYVPNKRLDTLIRVTAAIKHLFKRQVRLRLHGKVWNRDFVIGLRRLAEDVGVEHEVTFALNQPVEALRTSLASADAFVSASEHEGFMVPLVEAFSAGCPVVALASTAVTETCGPAALLVHDADPEEMAARIIITQQDRDFRYDLIRRQTARAADFAEYRTMAKWNAALQELLEEPLSVHAHRI